MNGVTDVILNGNLLVVGRLVDASNATLLASIEGTDPVIEVIYKPVAGDGFGMVQEWIKTDQSIDVVDFGQSSDQQLRKLALFDAIINNTDRKFGHLLVDENGVLKGCDHGVAFHSENKLRTVLWQFAEEPFLPEELILLNNVRSIDLHEVFSSYLTKAEISAISSRVEDLISSARFPEPSDSWPAVPWPPV